MSMSFFRFPCHNFLQFLEVFLIRLKTTRPVRFLMKTIGAGWPLYRYETYLGDSLWKISVSPNFRSAGPKWFGRIELKIEAWKSVWKLRSLWLPYIWASAESRNSTTEWPYYLPSWQVVNLVQGHTLWQVSLPSLILVGKTNGWNSNMLTWTREASKLEHHPFRSHTGKALQMAITGKPPPKKTKPSTAKVINFDLP